ncbi:MULTISPECIES: hypothetical protein [unclassified Paenibacillus]|uniref:hypothetical protein n=1 Tax=unclassified Paenibacillus TaxID=185978 RepID=UPI001AE344CC|nr:MULTISPECIES: hypothetical protein [unclassified Paenibacillus]MBP1155546.1 hypothetical protein [Paenibacillus sp. PvP091]MBP1169068.1 hypothetical protein [Paenibacillus sp. PvR098]MBP2440096.1 hypothetical protein [Paenibacillus sp. PvP052]
MKRTSLFLMVEEVITWDVTGCISMLAAIVLLGGGAVWAVKQQRKRRCMAGYLPACFFAAAQISGCRMMILIWLFLQPRYYAQVD